MKKRILSLAMAACLALSMMLTLSACGKKNLEEYFNTDTMQKLRLRQKEPGGVFQHRHHAEACHLFR